MEETQSFEETEPHLAKTHVRQKTLELKYIFGKVHPLAKPCWLIRIADMNQLMMVHGWVCSRLSQKYGMNPHLAPEIEQGSMIGVLYNPVVLGAKWLATNTLRAQRLSSSNQHAGIARRGINSENSICP